MKKSLAHLPKQKQTELMLITEKISDIVPQAELILLFGSYARGDWVDGPHIQGRGRLTIRKTSDYDIFVVTRFAYTARDYCPLQKMSLRRSRRRLRQSQPRNTIHEIRDTIFHLDRYDRHYKITKEQLEQLAPCVKILHEVTEKICKEKIKSFV
jgi:predicted nucleotidyltransferase